MKRIGKILAIVAAVLLASCCRKAGELPETGRYYNLEADGMRCFVWFDSCDQISAEGHYYAVRGDSLAPRHNFSAHLGRRIATVTSDGVTQKFKVGGFELSPYQEPVFEEKDLKRYRKPYCDVAVTKDICYGHAEGYWTSLSGVEQDMLKLFSQGYFKSFRKHDLDLTLDLYQPERLSSKRPLILFIHGGAFYIGSKDEPAYMDFCNHFASMGYITASINYRLGFHVSKNEIERAGYVALQDAHAAIRYLVAHADEYGIDPRRIFVAGSSAGGITALNLAFMNDDVRPASSRGKKAFLVNKADLGGIESSGNDIKAAFKIRAIANMWGAVSDLDILENSRTSIVSFHGECDDIVPYAEGYPLTCAGDGIARMLSEEMYGSACIDKKAGEVGLRHRFYSFPGEGHAFNTDENKQPNENHKFIRDRISEFFFQEIMPEKATIRSEGGGLYSIKGRDISGIRWKVEGGFILSQPSSSSIRILWCADKPHSLKASGLYDQDVGWIASL